MIGAVSVRDVDTALITKILESIWLIKSETAVRLRGRIEAILDWATVRGYRRGENPARWRGHLDKLLPARAHVRKLQHHAALPYQELPEFMVTLRAQPGIAARALEFLILTATRTGEVIGARPSEIADGRLLKDPVRWSEIALGKLFSGAASEPMKFLGLSRNVQKPPISEARRKRSRPVLTSYSIRTGSGRAPSMTRRKSRYSAPLSRSHQGICETVRHPISYR